MKKMRSKKTCNWCGSVFHDEREKPYCTDCEAKCCNECVTCHKPYPSQKFFNLSETRCDSCQKRHDRAKEKRKMKQQAEVDDDQDEIVSLSSSMDSLGEGEESGNDTELCEMDEDDDEVGNVIAEVKKAEGAASAQRKEPKQTVEFSADSKKDIIEKDDAEGYEKKLKKRKAVEVEKMSGMMKLLTEHQNKKLKKVPVDSKLKRKYNRKDTKSDKALALEEDLLKAFFAYRRGTGGKIAAPVLHWTI